MKKYSFVLLMIILFSGISGLVVFYKDNIKSIFTAIGNPPDNIVSLIESTTNQSKNGEETPAMPLRFPPGFSISIYAKGLIDPRVLAYDPAGNIIVSIPSEGKVLALKDENRDGFAEKHIVVAEGLKSPHGLATRCINDVCTMYIAETDQVARYDFDTYNIKAINKKKIIDLPGGGNHFSRTLMFMPYPDHDRLLVSVGSSCNVCNEHDDRRAKILSANFDGSDLKTFASGLRNSVFMAIHPVNGKIWATEMGRDLLGDDTPPDEINLIEEGKNYGWPICYGKNIHDTEFDKNTYIRNPCMAPFEVPSYIDIPAHSAPLGLTFFPEEGWPEEYWYNLLVAYHGSWNRSEPTGYKIVRYKLDAQGNYLGAEDFISGWLTKEGALGRPVDILIQPGGTIYVSDDKAGAVYKVIYTHASNNDKN